MRISDWSSDVCSSDLAAERGEAVARRPEGRGTGAVARHHPAGEHGGAGPVKPIAAAFAAPLVQQEVFGPVLSFEIFEDEADAIKRANATEFGLAAGIFTNDVARSYRVTRGIRAGTVWTNTWAAINDRFEEGGFKQSGIGRLRGTRGMEEFQEVKTSVHLAAAA